MPRMMSFKLTVPQILDQTKTVTRRTGWEMLRPGEEIIACDKLPRSGHGYRRLARLRVVSVTRELLDAITYEDCKREGFPDLLPADFVAMFSEKMNCAPWVEVTRIEFEYVEMLAGGGE